jgi:hypothetical protein
VKRRPKQKGPLTKADLSPHDRAEVERFEEMLRHGARGVPQGKAYVLVYGEIGAPLPPKDGAS